MKYTVKYSNVAIQDMERVWAEVFNASKDIDTTEKYIDDLMDTIDAKSDYPKSGIPLYYQNSFTGYYYVIFKAYLAFYRIEDNLMLVDRVLFGKSDYIQYLHLET